MYTGRYRDTLHFGLHGCSVFRSLLCCRALSGCYFFDFTDTLLPLAWRELRQAEFASSDSRSQWGGVVQPDYLSVLAMYGPTAYLVFLGQVEESLLRCPYGNGLTDVILAKQHWMAPEIDKPVYNPWYSGSQRGSGAKFLCSTVGSWGTENR